MTHVWHKVRDKLLKNFLVDKETVKEMNDIIFHLRW